MRVALSIIDGTGNNIVGIGSGSVVSRDCLEVVGPVLADNT